SPGRSRWYRCPLPAMSFAVGALVISLEPPSLKTRTSFTRGLPSTEFTLVGGVYCSSPELHGGFAVCLRSFRIGVYLSTSRLFAGVAAPALAARPSHARADPIRIAAGNPRRRFTPRTYHDPLRFPLPGA